MFPHRTYRTLWKLTRKISAPPLKELKHLKFFRSVRKTIEKISHEPKKIPTVLKKAYVGTVENFDFKDHPIIHETDELASSLIEQEFSYLQDPSLEDEHEGVDEKEDTQLDPNYMDVTSDSIQSQKTKAKKSGGSQAATLPRRSQRKAMKRE
uniref:Uncharacterized protein n=1 Tax=Romanomermis culicivorax TaxID=13658 RepID=A0A915HLV0_ROMCU